MTEREAFEEWADEALHELAGCWQAACKWQRKLDAEICQNNKYEDGSQYDLEECEKSINWVLDKTVTDILNQGEEE